jgi:hypothetical protein
MRGAWWRLALLIVAAGAAAIPLPETTVERLYANGAYPAVQPIVTTLTNAIPFAILDLLILAAIAWVIWRARVRARDVRIARMRRAFAFGADLVAFAALAYLSFLVLWGLNYRRLSADARFAVDVKSISEDRLRLASAHAGEAVNALHAPASASQMDEREVLTSAFARALQRLPAHWQPVAGRPKRSLVARLFPLGGVDGMMNPWGLEVVLNPEVLPFERPFVLAHEWAHLAGHAAESDASFVAWLACLEGGRDLQYSGWLSIYLHLVRALPPADRVTALERLAPGPRRDLESIRRRLEHAQPLVQGAAWRAYDQYLRANRVESGIANYDAVTRLVLGSRYGRDHLTVR